MHPSGLLYHALADNPDTPGAGSGRHLPFLVLFLATLSATFATVLSLLTIVLQLKNYRKITLQRFTVRILVMVPIYATSSCVSLFSLDLAFFYDAIRDVYEAFVIYCFFTLLVEYLGGERSFIILLTGRDPIPHPWPISIFYAPMDVSDPFTYLGLKRGILQYVQLKPVLTVITLILKATGKYQDGSLESTSGYTYIALATNASVSLSLYCLVMFWKATHNDLLPFRPLPKFLCVKGIIFFSFWQGLAVSVLVAIGLIRSTRLSSEMLSLAIQDTIICFEMPFFAFLHMYAFSYTDYIDSNHVFSGRLPFYFALRDAFGLKDVVSDSITTLHGSGFSYKTFEPASGGVHRGAGMDRRVRAGLRYANGGTSKYWLPMPGDEADAHGVKGTTSIVSRPIHSLKKLVEDRMRGEEGYAPIGEDEAREILHRDDGEAAIAGETEEYKEEWRRWRDGEGKTYDEDDQSETESLGFGEAENDDVEEMYADSRRLEYGDYNYPILDASREDERRRMREEEDGIIHNYRSNRQKGKGRHADLAQPSGPIHRSSYGRLAERHSPSPTKLVDSHSNVITTSVDHPEPEGTTVLAATRDFVRDTLGASDSDEEGERMRAREMEEKDKLPSDAVDLMVVDTRAEEEEMIKDRRRGEPGGKRKRVYRQLYNASTSSPSSPLDSPALAAAADDSPVTIEIKDTIILPGLGSTDAVEVVRVRVQETQIEATEIDVPAQHGSNGTSSSDNPWT